MPTDKWYGNRNLDMLKDTLIHASQLLVKLILISPLNIQIKSYNLFYAFFVPASFLLILLSHLQGILKKVQSGGGGGVENRT